MQNLISKWLTTKVEVLPMHLRQGIIQNTLLLFLNPKLNVHCALIMVLFVAVHAAEVARRAIPVVKGTVKNPREVSVQQAQADQDQVCNLEVASEARHPPALPGRKQWKRRLVWLHCT